ncbi:MAG: molybdopterin molybdenumtransferase MoeA [Betaproteobacteria bacterium]|nr:molybdopterin molybdenumtransferase MoeA [Betaproteobacteria bacterium]
MSDQPMSIRAASCADDYDPNSMPVVKARELIARFLTPVSAIERLNIRAALDRVLAADVVSPLDVPAHDNSAMDGYAGDSVRIGGGHRQGQNLRRTGEDLKRGQIALKRGLLLRPAEIGLIASLGIGEVSVFRRLRVAFFSTGDELRSIGTPLGAGQIYDSNRYTIHGMLARLGCEAIDMGVVRDDPKLLEQAFADAAAAADVVITSGGVSVGEADFVKELLERLGEVVFWKIAMKPGRPLAYGRIANAHFFGLPGNPVSVMVTFYQFVREALLTLAGRDPVPPLPSFTVPCLSSLKKAPGRTEFQRGVLAQDASGHWSVRVTGEQGSGILSSMSEANCFIILPEAQGNVAAGTMVEVQVMEGIV